MQVNDPVVEFRFGRVPGGVEVESENFKGPVCEAVVKKLTEGIGRKVSEEYSPDYYESPDSVKESTSNG